VRAYAHPAVAREVRLLAFVAQQRARLLVALAAGGYVGLLHAIGGHAKWTKVGVPVIPFWFGDLRNVTSAWECVRQHLAVLPSNPCDPYHRPANYPRLWLLPSHLGLGQGDTYVLGWVVAILFFVAAVAVVPRGASLLLGALYAVALCSAATMLGVERGNVDLLLYALVVLGVLVAGRALPRLALSGGCILLAAMLKLFPILAVGFLLRRATRQAWAVGAGVLVAFAAYVLALHRQIHQVVHAIPQADKYSFGLRRVTEWLSAATEGKHATAASLPSWDVLVVLVLLGVVVYLVRTRRPRAASGAIEGAQRELDLFWAGACVYVGCYLAGRSYDYRLVFCLLTLPQLARWAAARSALAYVSIAALLGSMWLDGWYDSPTIRNVLDGWSGWTNAGPSAQPLPLSAIAQFVLFATLGEGTVATSHVTRVANSTN
jgi:hypothetical protein